ncbi:hypothetical protein ACROYT_G009559 [Oculina patagonica]
MFRRSLFDSTVASQRNLGNKADSDGENVADIPQLYNSSPIVDDREDFKDESLYTFCGSCKNHVMTMVTYKAEVEVEEDSGVVRQLDPSQDTDKTSSPVIVVAEDKFVF